MLLLFIYSFTNFIVFSYGEQDPSKYTYGVDENTNLNRYFTNNHPILKKNFSYIDKSENMLRIPVMPKYYEENKSKRKSFKKTPKSTIQKIIKKKTVKVKKFYVVSSKPTPLPEDENDNIREDESLGKEEPPTTQTYQMKKLRRWNSKVARYPMPFQKLQSRMDYVKRNKRSVERDVFLLTDFDEIEFLSKEKDADVVKAHVKKYWELN